MVVIEERGVGVVLGEEGVRWVGGMRGGDEVG